MIIIDKFINTIEKIKKLQKMAKLYIEEEYEKMAKTIPLRRIRKNVKEKYGNLNVYMIKE